VLERNRLQFSGPGQWVEDDERARIRTVHFVAETADRVYMLEPKAANQMTDAEVLAKKEVAVTWCGHASNHAASYGGKGWKYVLIPHDAIADNMTLDGLAARFST
jgi:type III restriction enzyme